MKSILITGASSGIGADTARIFLEAGWQVGLLARKCARVVGAMASKEAMFAFM